MVGQNTWDERPTLAAPGWDVLKTTWDVFFWYLPLKRSNLAALWDVLKTTRDQGHLCSSAAEMSKKILTDHIKL